MTSLSKTTLNFVKSRGMDIQIADAEVIERNYNMLWIYLDVDDCEPSLFYIANGDGSFTYSSALGVSQEIKEELPAYIKDEKHLREVVKFLYVCLK